MGPIGSLFGVGSTSTPSAGGAGNQGLELLQGLIKMQPSAFATQSNYGPQYTALTAGETGTASTDLSSLLSTLLPGITGSIDTANTAAAGSQVNNLATLGPQAASAIAATNPGEANILSSLNDTAGSELKAGTTLAPSDLNNITSSVRGNWASRGLGTSDPAQLDEGLNLYAGGQSTLNSRISNASGVANLDNSLVTGPAMNLAGTTSTAPVLSNSLIGSGMNIAGPSGNTLTDPTSLLSGAYNAEAAANITNANNSAALNSY